MINENKRYDIDFQEDGHIYHVNGNRAVSVTELLGEVGITKDYSALPSFVKPRVEKAKDRGIYYDQLATEAVLYPYELNEWQQRFLDFLEENNIKIMSTQKRVGTLEPFAIAGTMDFEIINTKTNNEGIMDLKATALIYINDVTWQTNFYSYFNVFRNNKEHAKKEKWVIHYDEASDNFAILQLDHIDAKQINKAIESYQLGEKYGTFEMVLGKDFQIQRFSEAMKEVQDFKEQIKEAEKEVKEFEKRIMKEMSKYYVKTIETPEYKITYTPPGTRRSTSYKNMAEGLAERLKIPFKDLVDSYSTEGKVAERLTITKKK